MRRDQVEAVAISDLMKAAAARERKSSAVRERKGESQAATGVAGAAVLVWWAVVFHPAHEQLWMVPVGLVLLGTPLVAWLPLFASGTCRRLGSLRTVQDQVLPPFAIER